MKKKILIAGPKFHDYSTHIKTVFELNGHTVFFFDVEINGGFFNKSSNRKNIEAFNLKIRKCISEQTIDHVIILKGNRVFRDTLTFIHDRKIPLILMLWDSLENSISDNSYLRYFDTVLLFEGEDRKFVEKEGVKSIFYGTPVSLQNYYPIEQAIEDVDISFVGGLGYPERIKTLEAVVERFPELNIHIYGHYLSKRNPKIWKNYYLKKFWKYFKNMDLPADRVNEIYSRSKICINIQHPQSRWGCNYRTFEILAARKFQISSTNTFLNNEFRSGGLATYKTLEELFEKIQYYLNHKEERCQQSAIGYQYVMQHSYENKFHIFGL